MTIFSQNGRHRAATFQQVALINSGIELSTLIGLVGLVSCWRVTTSTSHPLLLRDYPRLRATSLLIITGADARRMTCRNESPYLWLFNSRLIHSDEIELRISGTNLDPLVITHPITSDLLDYTALSTKPLKPFKMLPVKLPSRFAFREQLQP